jgi:hypothetical protein
MLLSRVGGSLSRVGGSLSPVGGSLSRVGGANVSIPIAAVPILTRVERLIQCPPDSDESLLARFLGGDEGKGDAPAPSKGVTSPPIVQNSDF